jgi:hypothetical protein
MNPTEHWRPIPGLDGYEASDQGRIRSLRRGVPYLMKVTAGPCGYNTLTVVVRPGRHLVVRVPVLVASAWIGPRPSGLRIRHLNANPLDDRAENLRYGTSEEVRADETARARREEAAGAPTHCPAGHRLSDTWLGDYGRRVCRRCRYESHQGVKDLQARVGWCVDCGTELPPKKGSGPLRLRCDEHALEARRGAVRRHDRKRTAQGRR